MTNEETDATMTRRALIAYGSGAAVSGVLAGCLGSDDKKLIVVCLFVGPALLVSADVGARLGMSVITGDDIQIPVGIVTGLIGGPYFLYLMRKQENIGEI